MTKKASYPHVEKAIRYAKDVVAGKILACRYVKLACKRFLDDLERAKSKAYPYTLDKAKAEKSCLFAELLPHVKGQWAARGEKIMLQPFQCFRRVNMAGWVRKSDGRRRFQVVYEERPRKNAKSTDAAIDGLEGFAADGEFGAEVYSGATTEKQAWEVFRPAHQMASRTPEFREAYGVQVNAKSLTILANGSRFEPVIGKPGDGASPSRAIVDEYHEHLDSTLYDTMETGMGARTEPMLIVITTAGDDIAGPCYQLRDRVVKMLEGAEDERLFGMIYTIDEDVDWTSEEALRMANPNYDVSVDAEWLKEQQRAAINDAGKQNTFKTKHLNVWCSARSPWMNMEWWSRCADAPDEAEFAGDSVALGSDLASRLDLASVARVYRRDIETDKVDDEGNPVIDQHFYVYGRHYCPEAAVQDPRNKHFQKWEHNGHLTATDGNDIDLKRIGDDMLADAGRATLGSAMFDPWNCRAVIDRLRDEGIDPERVVEVPQQTMQLSPAMKDLEAAVASGRFHHTGDPVLTWAVSNVTVKPDAKDNIFPRKDRPENKIDPATALILAFKGAQAMQIGAASAGVSFG